MSRRCPKLIVLPAFFQVNVDEAVELLRFIESRLPLFVGHIFSGKMRWASDYSTYASGGAGMLLTGSAATMLSRMSLLDDSCGVAPSRRLNDIVLSACAWAAGVALIHSNALLPEMDTVAMTTFRIMASVAQVGSVISIHRVHPPYMHEWIDRDLRRTKYVNWTAEEYLWAPAPVPQ